MTRINALVTSIILCLFSSLLSASTAGNVRAVTNSSFHDSGEPSAARVKLGRLLFFDKILSGNLNISCASCHHPLAATGDGLSLPVGEGGRGLGVTRDNGFGNHAVIERVPRKSPPLFNLGAQEFVRLFHDGRVEEDPFSPSGFRSPAGDYLPEGLANVLAVQAMFPVTSATEMAGQAGENPQADAAALGRLSGPEGVWELIAQKLREIPDYVDLFISAYPDEIYHAADITFVHAANAIAAFEAIAWRFDNSPFDRYLRGDHSALSPAARAGMKVFYGKAGCGDCHRGAFQTDHEFHAIAMPQIGPGKGDNSCIHTVGHDDFGRERVTGDSMDRFKFRTPSLRNVALSAPYGHSGAYDSLEAVLRHHLEPINSLHTYQPEQATLPPRADLDALDFIVMENEERRQAIADSNELTSLTPLKEKEIQALLAFLHSLTDRAALDMRSIVPAAVPSGLPLWD